MILKAKKYLVFLGAVVSLALISSCGTPKESTKPNIVFIFTDDQTYTAVNALGNEEIITPNIDRLVHNGTSFTHAYNMGSWSGAVCAASRAMIISGRSVWRANEFRQKWIKGDTIASQMTWPSLMRENGYDTYMTGKWHVDVAPEKIFDRVEHKRPGMPRDTWLGGMRMKQFDKIDLTDYEATAALMPVGYNRPLENEVDNWDPANVSFGGFWSGGKHWSEVLKDDALGFIEEAKTKEDPFFMYLAFNAPHDPRQAPQEFIDMYPLDSIDVPESFLPLYPHKDAIANSPRLRDEALAPFPRTPYAIKKHIQEYYAIITHLDVQIGEIIDELEKSGKMENTYIFFTADHGLAMGRHGLLGKQNMFDHSIRPPLMVMGPGIPQGQKIEADVYLQDIMASSLELAGIDKPDYVEFNSFIELAKGKRSNSYYESIYGAYLKVQRMIRKDNYKLIVYPNIKKTLLFDLLNDPEEMTDLSELPEYSKSLAKCNQHLMIYKKKWEIT